jgi:hypothetical protein
VAVLSSNTIQISNLSSLAVRTVNTGSGPVKVIELSASSATMSGLNLQGPCQGNIRVTTTAATESANGGLVLDVTALQASILGVSITIAAADFPDGPLTLPGISLPTLPTNVPFLNVTMFVQEIRSASLALGGAAIVASSC